MAAHQAGRSTQQIATATGLSRSRIHQCLQDNAACEIPTWLSHFRGRVHDSHRAEEPRDALDPHRTGPPNDLYGCRTGAATACQRLELTYPEALALICDEMHEAARGGASYEDVMHVGQSTLSAADVLEGVAELIGTIKIECLFGDGMRVLHVEQPIGPGQGGAP